MKQHLPCHQLNVELLLEKVYFRFDSCKLFTSIFCYFLILGGETIKQINMQTGAHCEIDRRHNNTGSEKTFVIRGTTEQIENAKRMINEKLGFVRTFFNIFFIKYICFYSYFISRILMVVLRIIVI